MTREDRIRKLKGIIEDAFKDISYPGDHNIAAADHCKECFELARAFAGKRWQEITLEFLRKDLLAQGLPLFKPGALRFYLPAFLIISIEHYDEADIIPDCVLNMLVPDSAEPDSHFLERFEALTSQQKRAVRLFLEYLVDEYPDEHSRNFEDSPLLGIERYWGDK